MKNRILFNSLMIALMLILALPAKAQSEYYTFSPNFWADKQVMYDSGYQPVNQTGESNTTVVALPKIEYNMLHDGEEYCIFVCIEADEALWYGWDLGGGFFLEDEVPSVHGHCNAPDTLSLKMLEYDGMYIHNLNTSNSIYAIYGECACHDGEEDTGFDCGCDQSYYGTPINFCGCSTPYFEISEVLISSYLYNSLRIIIYKMAETEEE